MKPPLLTTTCSNAVSDSAQVAVGVNSSDSRYPKLHPTLTASLFSIMKSLRKSLNGNKETFRQPISTPIPTLPKASQGVVPPQKVIRALVTHKTAVPQELSFEKGDFFYVTRDLDTQATWYEAHNPITGARGVVPRSMFEEIVKSPAPIRTSQIGTPGMQSARPESGMSMTANLASPIQSSKHKSFFAVVLHDFAAEREDELDAKSGDPIFVVAQSNREWFVAKPIGKLGRPGLIPVAFVEIRDPITSAPVEDVMSLIESGELPTVEDWKRQILNYKQNSIPLGTLDEHSNNPVANSPYTTTQLSPSQTFSGSSQQAKNLPPPPRSSSPTQLPPGILLSADVVSFHEEMNDFWFRVDAIYQPFHPSMSDEEIPPAKQLVLFRVYNDFYDFQVKLLNTFPREAGRKGGSNRILPYMPGPADNVDTAVTASRRLELGEYLLKLCELSFAGARHILEHDVIREFLAVKPGDVESEVPPKILQIEAVYGEGNMEQMGNRGSMASSAQHGYENHTAEQITRLSLGGRRPDDAPASDGSEYEDDLQRQRHQPQGSQSSLALRQQALANHHKNESVGQPFAQSSRPPHPQYPQQMVSSRSNSPPFHLQYTDSVGHSGPQAMTRSTSGRDERSSAVNSEHGRKQSVGSATARVLSPSIANHSTAPPISAQNPQTAFIKIKIFDRVTDDLVAIRVHPQITHVELMNKVQARLGGEVKCLRFRDAQTKEIQNLANDDDLVEWLAETEKPILYAD